MQRSAFEKSYWAIRQNLENGELGPGDKLVTRTLAGQLGVSLSPIREAINRLANEGLVEHTPGAGAEVKRLSTEDLNDLYVLRDAIESCAAGLAAELTCADDLEELELIVSGQAILAAELTNSDQASATKSQMSKWLTLEERFHETIMRCARNQLLAKVVRDHRTIGRVFESHLIHESLLNAEVANRTVSGKRELLDAFRKRDPESAKAIMSQQIRNGRRHVIGILREKGIQ